MPLIRSDDIIPRMTKLDALKLAIKNAGGQVALARKLKITQSAVANWILNGTVPIKRVLDVERHGGVSRYDLLPEAYPRERGRKR